MHLDGLFYHLFHKRYPKRNENCQFFLSILVLIHSKSFNFTFTVFSYDRNCILRRSTIYEQQFCTSEVMRATGTSTQLNAKFIKDEKDKSLSYMSKIFRKKIDWKGTTIKNGSQQSLATSLCFPLPYFPGSFTITITQRTIKRGRALPLKGPESVSNTNRF